MLAALGGAVGLVREGVLWAEGWREGGVGGRVGHFWLDVNVANLYGVGGKSIDIVADLMIAKITKLIPIQITSNESLKYYHPLKHPNYNNPPTTK